MTTKEIDWEAKYHRLYIQHLALKHRYDLLIAIADAYKRQLDRIIDQINRWQKSR